MEMKFMGFRGRRRNLAWWRGTQVRTNINTPRNIQNLGTGITRSMAPVPAGYRYVGYCRCGYGPNAYYQTPDGRTIPAYQLFAETSNIQPQTSYPNAPASPQDREKILKERLERLQEEIAEVTNQLEELEGKKKRFPFKWRQKS